MKKKLIVGSFLTLLLVPLTMAYAQDNNPKPSRALLREERLENRQASAETRKATGTQLRKDKALLEIDRRVTRLNRLINKINALKRLTDAQKSALVTQVQDEINTLTALKTKIQSETDPAQLQADKKSIVLSYRVYALFVPKIQIIAHADRIMNVAELMAKKTTNADALKKINDAKTLAQGAIDTVVPLTPEGYPGNKSSLQSARNNLKVALKDLNDARKLMKSTNSSSSSSSTTSSSSSSSSI